MRESSGRQRDVVKSRIEECDADKEAVRSREVDFALSHKRTSARETSGYFHILA